MIVPIFTYCGYNSLGFSESRKHMISSIEKRRIEIITPKCSPKNCDLRFLAIENLLLCKVKLYSHWGPSRTNAPCVPWDPCTVNLQGNSLCSYICEIGINSFFRQNGHQSPSLSPHPPPRSNGTLWRLISLSFLPPGLPLPITHTKLVAFASRGSQ